ncbi:MAG TPA: hemerythrin domain-containing protein [Candidatus Tectomicrobia bacterium]
MMAEITKLDSPIDVMYLLHKALRAEAARLEQMSERLTMGESLQPLQEAFQHWGKALGYHAAVEDQYMTAPLADLPPVRGNEVSHQGLEVRLEDLQEYLMTEAGPTCPRPKTRRHLYGKLVALRIAQDDHLEEEAFVLPMIRQRIPEAQQLEMARRLLVDGDGPPHSWIMEWVAGALTATECELLADVAARFKEIPTESLSR